VVKVLGVGVTVEVGLRGVDLDLLQCLFVGMGWSDAVHIGSGFWRERGWEERHDPACKRNARRLTSRGG
jgi:hypothetical protein